MTNVKRDILNTAVGRIQIVDSTSNSTGETKNDVKAVLEMLIEEIRDALAMGEPIELRGFAQFVVRAKAARVGRNPRTGVEANITPRRVVSFRPGGAMLKQINRQHD
jgi:integration host factor subunit alpha